MRASDTFEEEFLDLLFKNIAITGIGDAGGLLPSSAAGNLYIRLCTDDTECDDSAGGIGTECSYTGYVAGGVAVARGSGFDRTGNVVSNAEDIEFGACTVGSENIKYAELWRDNSHFTEPYRIGYSAAFDPVVPISPGSTPRFKAGALTFTFD